jgi:nitrogen-specific signal transduction histidine kinase/ActR/RegA family two-component response regulator
MDESGNKQGGNSSVSTVATLAAGVAHEINNPTACILANLEHLLSRLRALKNELGPGDTKQRQWIHLSEELLGESHVAATRIRDIVAELKRFSQPDEEERSDVSVNTLLGSALDFVMHEVRYRATVVKDLSATVPNFTGQAERLKQLFLNLLTNAAQAIDEGEPDKHHIWLRTWSDGSALFVQVKDDGRGIAPETMPHIFTPFFTTKPVGVGVGLGLSTAQDIAKKHGGEVRVTSELGKGTTVEVRFPLQNGSPAARVAQPAKTRRRVLLVDDEPHLLKALQRMISQNHEVAIALGGQTAIDILAQRDFDLVISDVMMPEVDGIDLYHHIATTRPGQEKRVVFVTGGVFTTRVQDFLQSIPNRRIQKPFTPDDIFALIDDATREQ